MTSSPPLTTPDVGPGPEDELLALELGPLIGFASLLTLDPATGEALALDAFAGDAQAREDPRPAVALRAAVVRMARRRRGRAAGAGGDSVLRALGGCPLAERVAVICVVHERLVEAEVATILGRAPEQVSRLVERGCSRIQRLTHANGVSLEARLRVAMREATARVDAPDDPRGALAERRQARRRAMVVRAVVAFAALGVAAGLLVVARSGNPGPPAAALQETFEHPAAGYRLTVHPRWRDLPTLAEPNGAGAFDPSRFGLAALAPLDEVAAFIPRRSGGSSALLRITVSPTVGYHADLERARDRLTLSRTPGTILTSALDTVGGRPATRFRVDYPADGRLCPGCRSLVWIVHWTHGTTMTAALIVFGPVADDALLMQGWTMMRSLERAESSATVRYLPVSGWLAGEIAWDEHTEAVLQFLDARVRGRGAEEWLAETGSLSYRRLALHPVESYRVLGRDAGSSGTASFTVELHRRGPMGTVLETERILVGPGNTTFGTPWPMLVLSASGD